MFTLSKVSLNNFKCFAAPAEPNEVELRRLTLFYGYNNAGKSAFLRGICMTLNSLIGDGPEPLTCALPVFSQGMTLGDVVTKDKGSHIEIGIELRQEPSPSTTNLTWRIVDLPERGTHVVDRFRATSGQGGRVILDARWRAGEESDGSLSRSYEVSFEGSSPVYIDFRFHGLLPTAGAQADVPEGLRRFLDAVRKTSPKKAFWLSSHRIPSRRYFPKQPAWFDLDANGDGFESLLFQSWRRPANLALFEAVSAWYERNLKQKLTIVEHAREFEIAFAPSGTPYRVNICDVGQGLQETLPLLTVLHAYRLDDFSMTQVAVEEPESHLHPSLHAALGREFCSLVGQPGAPRVLLETHSQNLLLAV
ncbi:MAG: AAA family ATPase [Planctomycetota bacterium]|nr:AAA family ATPase [Planctomycetota bacterium]